MVSISTHTFKTVDNLDLKIDVYTTGEGYRWRSWSDDQIVVHFIHGGGMVSHDRRHLPPHIVQSCLKRGWPLVSSDYRKLPQATGQEILNDCKDAYKFIVNDLYATLNKGEKSLQMKNIILVGASAGGNLVLLCGHYVEPRPVAILEYYGVPTIQDSFFHTNRIIAPSPIDQHEVEKFLTEPVTIGYSPPAASFSPESLLPDLTRNPRFVPLKSEPVPRTLLFPWFVQSNSFAGLIGSIDKGFEDESWKDFPPTVIIHGTADVVVPYEASVKLVGIIGPTPAKLYTIPGGTHAFDEPFFLGDEELAEVEEAWAALDDILKSLNLE